MCGHLNGSVLTKARSEILDGAPLVMGCSGGFSFTPPPLPLPLPLLLRISWPSQERRLELPHDWGGAFQRLRNSL
jgi:hypothetical protein